MINDALLISLDIRRVSGAFDEIAPLTMGVGGGCGESNGRRRRTIQVVDFAVVGG